MRNVEGKCNGLSSSWDWVYVAAALLAINNWSIPFWLLKKTSAKLYLTIRKNWLWPLCFGDEKIDSREMCNKDGEMIQALKGLERRSWSNVSIHLELIGHLKSFGNMNHYRLITNRKL